MGKGIAALFEAVLDVARKKTCPMPQAPTPHIAASLRELKSVISHPQIEEVFQGAARSCSQLAENDDYFLRSLTTHFPDLAPQIVQAARAEQTLPRPLPEEVHADRHHRAAVLSRKSRVRAGSTRATAGGAGSTNCSCIRAGDCLAACSFRRGSADRSSR